ncbi:MAG: zinc dependent phospholipase C family protein [Wujia sp.]
MPTTYAHYTFGQEVLKELEDRERSIIKKNIDMYNLGIYGPDFLFFHHPLIPNKIQKLGSKHHHQNYAIILEYATERIRKKNNPEAYMAYMYGFMCHFALDAYCHGFINHTSSEKGIRHNLQESEFDRMLMIRDGHDPIHFKPTGHMKPTKIMAQKIASIYPEVDEKIVYSSTKSMKRLCNVLVAPTYFSRAVIYAGLFVTGNYWSKSGMIIKHKPVKECEETNQEIYRLYKKAIGLAKELIAVYRENVFDNRPLPKVTYHTFSTDYSVEKELDNDR